mmetsp:Transcript_12253/g.31640  ORF Transcript_12253/g.31640 Transcript_12253/m.31640 type:complete len:239 (+) Transcript_12253:1300-2016(+)
MGSAVAVPSSTPMLLSSCMHDASSCGLLVRAPLTSFCLALLSNGCWERWARNSSISVCFWISSNGRRVTAPAPRCARLVRAGPAPREAMHRTEAGSVFGKKARGSPWLLPPPDPPTPPAASRSRPSMNSTTWVPVAPAASSQTPTSLRTSLGFCGMGSSTPSFLASLWQRRLPQAMGSDASRLHPATCVSISVPGSGKRLERRWCAAWRKEVRPDPASPTMARGWAASPTTYFRTLSR